MGGVDLKLSKFHFFNYYRTQNSVTKYKIDTFPEYAMDQFKINNTQTSNPIGGAIEVSLKWQDPSINMSLSSELGTKDVSSTECSPLEHYYVKSQKEISTGVYGVYVNSSGGVSESSLPPKCGFIH